MRDNEEKMSFEDSDSSRPAVALGIKEIALEQYKKCVIEGSKEMTTAGVIKRMINGEVFEIAVPDQREIFKNSVDMMKITLLDKFKANKKSFWKYIEEFEENKKKLRNLTIKQEDIINLEAKKRADKETGEIPDNVKRARLFHLNELAARHESSEMNIYKELLTRIALLMAFLNWFQETGVMGDIDEKD